MRSFIHKLILAQLPLEASRFRGEGLDGLAWVTGTDFVYLAFDPEGSPHCGQLAIAGVEQPDGTVAAPFDRRAGYRLDLRVLVRAPPLPPERRSTDPEALGIVARFAGCLDGDAIDAMIARGVEINGGAYAYVTHLPRPFGDRIDLCARHVWAVGVLTEAHALGHDLGPDGGASARVTAACIASARRHGVELDPKRLRSLISALNGASVPNFIVGEFPRLLPLLSELPEGPILPVDPDPDEALALLCVLYLAASHARYSGRPVARLLPPCGIRWMEGLRNLANRAGCAWVDDWGEPIDADDDLAAIAEWDDGDDEGPVQAVVENALSLLQAVTDMVSTFEEQVVVPALLEADPARAEELGRRPGAVHPAYAGLSWLNGDRGALGRTSLGISLRLLARDKSLKGFLDVVGDWHARRMRTDGVATRVNDGVTWTEAFPPWTAPNGLTLASISTARALTREGEDMRHCVAGYLGRCLRGSCVIVSVSDRDGGVATLELVFQGGDPHVRQLMGPGNTQPSMHARSAVDALVDAIRSGAVPIARDAVSWNGAPVRDHMIYVGHFAAMRDGWGRYVARELRSASPGEFVSEGLRMAPPAKGRTRRAGPAERPGNRPRA